MHVVKYTQNYSANISATVQPPEADEDSSWKRRQRIECNDPARGTKKVKVSRDSRRMSKENDAGF